MRRITGRRSLSLLTSGSAVVSLLLLAGCAALKTPTIAVDLPEQYNTPDGMVLAPNGDIILSMPNFNDDTKPAKMLRIDKDDKISEIITLPVHPETLKAGPLGVDIGPDGHLYIADNQAFGTSDFKSRLLRVAMHEGKATRCEVLVENFVMSNAVSCHGDSVYVTETKLNPDPNAYPLVSGVYRFELAELNPAMPIQLKKDGTDKHLICKTTTKNKAWQVGANGLGFDKAGNMYYCNFGDAQIIKVTFKADGTVDKQTVLAEGNGMLSTDGMKVHPVTGDIYVADFLGNAVHKVCPKTGKVTTLARNGLTDGAGGALDKPSEVCIRGNRCYVSNIDLNLDGNKFDKPHTISVIELDD
jgi:sugar lactone lactonase YvrE